MSSMNPSKDPSSSSTSTEPTANPPPAETSTRAASGPYFPNPIPFRRHPSSISSMDPSRMPFDPLPPRSAQVTPERSRPADTSTESEPQPSTRISHPSLRYPSSRSSLDLNRGSSESPTPPTSKDITPPSQPAGPILKPASTLSGAAPSYLPRPQQINPTSVHPSNRFYSTLQPQSARQSYSGDTLVDESASPLGLGSTIFTPGSVRSTPSHERMEQTLEVHRYEPTKHYYLVIQPPCKSVLNDVAHSSVPVAQWPEVAQGIIPFIDFKDEEVKNALPYFRSSVLALTKGLFKNSNLSYPERQAPARVVNPRLMTRHHSAYSLATRPTLQRGATTQISATRAAMRGNAQLSWPRPGSHGRVQRSSNLRVMRRSGPRYGRASRPIEQWIEQTAQHAQIGQDNDFWQQTEPVVWSGVVPRPSDGPGMMPLTGRGGFQHPPNPGRWQGGPTSFIHQPRPTYMPNLGRPDLRHRASLGYLPGAVQGLEHAATIGSADFGNGPHSAVMSERTIQAFHTYQRARGGMRGYMGVRGWGTARGRRPDIRRSYR